VRRGTIEDDRGLRETVGDGAGRHNVVRPRPSPGRTDCPVANTAVEEAGKEDSMRMRG